MAKLEVYSDVTHGTITPTAKGQISQHLRECDGKRVRITVDVARRHRSLPQNAYYHGVIVEACRVGLCNQWGQQREEVPHETAHDWLKRECNGKEVANQNTGEITMVPQSTTEHDTLQAEEYYERCRRWIKDWFNIDVPLPNTQDAADMITTYYQQTE